MADLELRCRCGSLGGILRGANGDTGNRVVCECHDCQTAAHALGAADRLLDARGGSEIFQTSPARLELTHGREHLACLRLTDRGLHRWYAACCSTPVGNSVGTMQVPFVGVFPRNLVPSAGQTLDAALGPIRARVNSPSQRLWRVLPAVLRFLRLLVQARLRGDQRRSPFFDPSTGALVVTPRVLSAAELTAARALVDARATGTARG